MRSCVCAMVWEQKATSRGVSRTTPRPWLERNHCRARSTRETRAMGTCRTRDAMAVTRSNSFWGRVSRIWYDWRILSLFISSSSVCFGMVSGAYPTELNRHGHAVPILPPAPASGAGRGTGRGMPGVSAALREAPTALIFPTLRSKVAFRRSLMLSWLPDGRMAPIPPEPWLPALPTREREAGGAPARETSGAEECAGPKDPAHPMHMASRSL
mmetsp:Transcript_32597/g.64615  ORF Transcript_32597/g.64615 Transcript_32597/m.64615 type:complete len:213 (+) Transcript_32597:2599-3237(+)